MCTPVLMHCVCDGLFSFGREPDPTCCSWIPFIPNRCSCYDIRATFDSFTFIYVRKCCIFCLFCYQSSTDKDRLPSTTAQLDDAGRYSLDIPLAFLYRSHFSDCEHQIAGEAGNRMKTVPLVV